ncbi:MAG TPA: DinB family protein [Gemmatimonadaceae bacterium]
MTKLTELLGIVLRRELASLRREVESYPDDASVWTTPPGISNATGNLALHCAGNLQHFFGARIAGESYVRNRDAEFARRDASRAELLAEIDRAADSVEHALPLIDDTRLASTFPEQFGGKEVRTDVFLLHLAVHLAYHLGQVDYHRRLTTGDSTTLGTVAVSALPAAN